MDSTKDDLCLLPPSIILDHYNLEPLWAYSFSDHSSSIHSGYKSLQKLASVCELSQKIFLPSHSESSLQVSGGNVQGRSICSKVLCHSGWVHPVRSPSKKNEGRGKQAKSGYLSPFLPPQEVSLSWLHPSTGNPHFSWGH